MFSPFMCSFQYGVFLSRTGHYDDKTYKCRNVHFFDKSIIEMGLGMAGLIIRPRKKKRYRLNIFPYIVCTLCKFTGCILNERHVLSRRVKKGRVG